MIEDLINKAKKDKRVDIDCVINNNIHMFKAIGIIKMKKQYYMSMDWEQIKIGSLGFTDNY